MRMISKPNIAKNLRELNEGQRNGLVISIAYSGHVLSRYSHNLWDLSPYIHTKGTLKASKRIDFSSLKFTDGSCLTDPQHSLLLAGVKALLYVRLTVNSPGSGKPLKASSVYRLWGNTLRPLLRWMTAVGHRCISDLSPDECMAYVSHSKAATAYEHNTSRSKGGKLGRLSPKALNDRFSTIEMLWTFRGYLSDSLVKHPWPGLSAGALAGYRYNNGNDTTTEQIPDRLMVQLVRGALFYVADGQAERLLACRDVRAAGNPIKDHLKQLGLKDWGSVSDQIPKVLTACFIIINAFSGMRVSEMLSLETSCYYEHEGWDGATYGWLKGITYKLEHDPRPVEWMVPPIVGLAVQVATKATEPLRKEMEQMIADLEAKLHSVVYLDEALRNNDLETLNEMKIHRNALFIGKSYEHKTIKTISDSYFSVKLKDFARAINLEVEPADLAQVRNKGKIKAGHIWPLATHQFRKTFARYVARCILGDVRYLKEHFKHWSLDMTLGYAWNEDDMLDPTLIEEILDEHQELQSSIVLGWVDLNRKQHLAGVGGKNIEVARERTKVLVATDPQSVARQLSKGYFLRGLGHSWCTEKECRGKGIYSVTECKECENRIIDESHIPVWRGIRQQQIDLLQIDDCGDPMWQGAADSLRYAENVLKDLGDKVAPYLVPPKPSERRKYV